MVKVVKEGSVERQQLLAASSSSTTTAPLASPPLTPPFSSGELNQLLTQSILPLLQSSGTLTKHDLSHVLKAVIALEPFINNYETSTSPENVSFYSSFVALAGNIIMSSATNLPKSQVALASNACLVLLQYLLHLVSIYTESASVLTKPQLVNLIQGFCVDVSPLMQPDICSLSMIIKSSSLPSELLPTKAASPPRPSLSSGSSQNVQRQDSSSSRYEREPESKRLRVEQSAESFMEQLMTPIIDTVRRDIYNSSEPEKALVTIGFSSIGSETKDSLMSKNIYNLQSLGGANTLLDSIMALPSIEPFIQLVQATEEGAPLKMPSSVQDAHVLLKNCKQITKDYDLLTRVLSLPILEPLVDERLSKLILTINACLYISVNLVAASSIIQLANCRGSGLGIHREDSEEGESFFVADIVSKSLDTYKDILSVMKSSLRVGGNVCQNEHLFATWILLSGIKYIISLTPSKIPGIRSESATSHAADASHRSDTNARTSSRMRQGYTFHCISLANHAVKSLNVLLDDLKSESGLSTASAAVRLERLTSPNPSNTFKYNKFGCYSAWQRIEMLMSNVGITNLLFTLASVSYRKAGTVKLQKHHSSQSTTHPNAATPSSISSTERGQESRLDNHNLLDALRTPSAGHHASDIDEECCFSSDESSRDEDSEPILGQLFETDYDREDGAKGGLRSAGTGTGLRSKSPSFNYDYREPHRHLALALYIVECFNTHFVTSDICYLRNYFKATLTETQIVVLTNIIKDLDRDPSISGFYFDFSKTITTFMHNLIAMDILSDGLQSALLNHLGVAPNPSNFWPLFIPTRTLSMMAQVLLLKQRKEKDELRSDTGTNCLHIWTSLIAHLKKLIVEPTTTNEPEKPQSRFSNSSEFNGHEFGDINVEHAQVLLFIFHNLKLLQRKTVLLTIAQTIIEVSPVVKTSMRDEQIHYLGRLVHFFEYMVKHLYEPPHFLVEQIDRNLFKTHVTVTFSGCSVSVINNCSRIDRENNNPKDSSYGSSTKIYFHARDIEESYEKFIEINPDCERIFIQSLKPRFYHLFPVDMNLSKDVPKLDGMAVNFILSGLPDVFSYEQLYDCIINLLEVSNQVDSFAETGIIGSERLTQLGTCAVNFTFNTIWRLILQLPPSRKYIQSLKEIETLDNERKVLQAIIWIPRLFGNKWYNIWICDSLNKMVTIDSPNEPPTVPSVNPVELLQETSEIANSFNYSMSLIAQFVNSLINKYGNGSKVIDSKSVPSILEMFVLESIIVRTLNQIENHLNGNDDRGIDNRGQSTRFITHSSSSTVTTAPGQQQQPIDSRKSASELLPKVISLISTVHKLIKWHLLFQMEKENKIHDMEPNMDLGNLESYYHLMALSGGKNGKLLPFSSAILHSFPKSLRRVLDKWTGIPIDTSSFKNDLSNSETMIQSIQAYHYDSLLSNPVADDGDNFVSVSLKHTFNTLIKFADELFNLSLTNSSGSSNMISNHSQSILFDHYSRVIVPMFLDSSLDSFSIHFSSSGSNERNAIDTIYGSRDSDEFLTMVYHEALKSCYLLVTNTPAIMSEQAAGCSSPRAGSATPTGNASPDFLIDYADEKCLIEIIKFIEVLLSINPGQLALEKFFCDSSDGDGHDDGCSEDRNIVDLLIPASKDKLSSSYASKILKLFVKLFEQTEKSPEAISLIRLCTSLTKLSRFNASSDEKSVLTNWLEKILFTKDDKSGEANQSESNQENRSLLQSFTSYIVKDSCAVDEDVASTFLSALIPMATKMLSTSPEVNGFPDVMVIMATLANASSGCGHIELVKVTCGWLETSKQYLSQKDVVEKINANVTSGRHQVVLESTCYMLSYLADIYEALKILSNESAMGRSASPIDAASGTAGANVDGGQIATDGENDWMDEMCAVHEEEDSNDEESDSDDSLCNKLCTFTVTQKEFMNQHWYHCHTCKMVDGVGVCTVCAKVCHKDHDVSYAKHGSFFCDCGAREDGACQALVKRPPTSDHHSHHHQSGHGARHGHQESSHRMPGIQSTQRMLEKLMDLPSGTGSSILPSSLRRKTSSPDPSSSCYDRDRRSDSQSRHQTLSRQIESTKTDLVNLLNSSNVSGTVFDLLEVMKPSIVSNCILRSPMGASTRAREAMDQLHSLDKRMESSDNLMVPTLGSQEGAFENVKLTYSGDQGAMIRQLISSNIIRRVAMTGLTSPFGKRQHLAVSHEKGKITLLQLSALLKQADSSKKKLTLTRLASAPVPFTTLTIAANTCNEDCLAVCGLKDCHVLTFSSTGTVTGHLVLALHLDAGNHVIKAMWLPGSQTELAVVTIDFIKIFDLSKSPTDPEYHLLPPSGKIRDVTFVFSDAEKQMDKSSDHHDSDSSGERNVMLMTNTGHVYCQILNEESRNGPFYVTTVLQISHEDIKETASGNVNGGGVSIYYSHNFQLLFMGFSNGKSFAASMRNVSQQVNQLFQIEVKSNSSSSSNGSPTHPPPPSAPGPLCSKQPTGPSPLCQWSEVPGHPGLVFAMSQTSNNPIVLMIKPDQIAVQEIRFLNVKAKITDMVALRHPTSLGDMRTTLILLCEDGSLRIYMASQDATNFWLKPSLNAGQNIYNLTSSTKSSSKRRSLAKSQLLNARGSRSGPSSTSFPVDFFEHCSVMSDIEFGGNDVLQVYNVQQVKHRLNTSGMYVASTKSNGFSVDVTNSDPNMVMVGARVMVGTQDVNRAPTYIELFGRTVPLIVQRSRWYDLPFSREESLQADKKMTLTFGPSNDPGSVTMIDSIKIYGKTKEAFSWPDDESEEMVNQGATAGTSNEPLEPNFGFSSATATELTATERFLSCALEVLEGYFLTTSSTSGPGSDPKHEPTLKLTTELLTLPFPLSVQQNIKSLLVTLHSSRSSFNCHRDSALLHYVIETLIKLEQNEQLDGESFYRLITITKSIATSRPSNLIKFSDFFLSAMSIFKSSSSSSSTSGGVQCEQTSSRSEDIEMKTIERKEETISKSLPPFQSPDHAENVNSSAFINYVNDLFWKLYANIPSNPLIAPIPNVGLVNIDSTVQSLIEVMHAFTLVDVNHTQLVSEHYLKLLLCADNQIVSFSAKQSIIRVLKPRIRKRRVFIPSPPRVESPPQTASKVPSQSLSSVTSDQGPLSAGHGAQSRIPSQGSLPEVFEQNQSAYFPPLQPSIHDHHNHQMVAVNPIPGLQAPDDILDIQVAGNHHLPFADHDHPHMMVVDPDAEDEAMVELAIALSLQDQGAGGHPPIVVPGVAPGVLEVVGVDVVEEGGAEGGGGGAEGYSDTTTSPPGSDDEGSTAATVGSTLRASPVNVNDSNVGIEVGSEEGSGGSPVESIVGEQNISGRSSAYGEDGPPGMDNVSDRRRLPSLASKTDCPESVADSSDYFDAFDVNNTKLHTIRLSLLEHLITNLDRVRDVGGIGCIPMMQVMLMLSSDLESEGEKDKNVLNFLLNRLLHELNQTISDIGSMATRTPSNEVKVIIMRLLSILMARVKAITSTPSGGVPSTPRSGHSDHSKHSSESGSAISSPLSVSILLGSNLVDVCLKVLTTLLDYWKCCSQSEPETAATIQTGPVQAAGSNSNQSCLLKHHSITPPPDMSPFFLRQYVKGHADDVFELYPQLLSEMVLRLPYQMKKISNAIASSGCGLQTLTPSTSLSASTVGLAPPSLLFSSQWMTTLCEYMMLPLTPYVRKQVRKLLAYVCGSKESYRQTRDFHALESHLKEIKSINCTSGANDTSITASSMSSAAPNVVVSLSYDATISLIDHLKSCSEIASNRTNNWQKYCSNKDRTILPFLMQISTLLEEGVSPMVLQLLLSALCPTVPRSGSDGRRGQPQNVPEGAIRVPITVLQGGPSDTDLAINIKLSHDLINRPDIISILSQFVKCFLLESNVTSLRWQAHTLMFNLFKNFDGCQKEQLILLDMFWSLWYKVPLYGRKSVQFVDLLGFFTIKANVGEEKEKEFCERALSVLRQQNLLLMDHPNTNLYNSLQSLVEFDGYYLESEPCLVCNNPEVNYSSVKLSSLKVDSRFTTSTHIIKLIGSHTISKISLKISDIKRSKMVKSLTVYYNNRSVSSIVDLKNKSGIWNKAKKCNLTAGQNEVKIDFPLPITACNLMIEYSDFYENIQASSETLQCPRCSASVPANPGVCGNCGENVYQCHKCRAINYDEKDPFLCNTCGFCKYAKFDYVLTAKPTCAVDPIENEEDRKKTVQTINTLLEKADRVYKNLMINKPALEILLLRVQEHGFLDRYDELPPAVNISGGGGQGSAPGPIAASLHYVNRAIQQIAIKYCGECKAAFDDLSKIIQKVLASRKELVDYDNMQKGYSIGGQMVQVHKTGTRRDSKVMASLSSASGRCYGCASSTVDHSITLMKAISSLPRYRSILCQSGLLKELLDYNLRCGTAAARHEVRSLLVTLTRDNVKATSELNSMILDKITTALKSRTGGQRSDFSAAVRHEIALLVGSLDKEDNCWELRLRTVMNIFLMGIRASNPTVLETITLPCLRLLISLVRPDEPRSKRNQDKTVYEMSTVQTSGFDTTINLAKWIIGDHSNSFRSWKMRSRKKASPPVMSQSVESGQKMDKKSKIEIHNYYLKQKYANKWRERSLKKNQRNLTATLINSNWLRSILFNRFSRTVRCMACSLIEALLQVPSRSQAIVDMLTSCLDDLGQAGEFGSEFFALYHSVIQQNHWKYHLALKGVLLHLGTLISDEIEKLNDLEEATLNSDLSEGAALKMFVDLLTLFVEVPTIRQQYKSRLVAFVLNGYLSLRKLVVQRTKLIDEAQDTLLELLEEMTTGTETETESFMKVCIEQVNRCKLDDLRTPVFIFERLCSIIYPEESDTIEFYINLEKDTIQEDFLQGRMLGNPYSSNDPGLGPLMRDIKNKICQDCELVALLEDDSGMELLVNNKIISLDLPVKDVYKKIWCSDNHQDEAMRIIYRMRGLMGDATEEFIASLDNKDSQEVDNEVVYRMANLMASEGGLEVMLQRLSFITDLSPRCRPLLLVLLKLFSHCVKVERNRRKLVDPNLKTISIMIPILKLAIETELTENNLSSASNQSSSSSGQFNVLEQLLSIMEVILIEAAVSCSPPDYDKFSSVCGSNQDIIFLLKSVTSNQSVRKHTTIMASILKITPYLVIGQADKMTTLLDYFKSSLNFKRFDFEHNPEVDLFMDCFCILVNGIETNHNGNRIKDMIVDETKVIHEALEYLTIYAPAIKSAILTGSNEWKEFTQRPALKYVLRILTGLVAGHEKSQLMVSAESIPVIHGLEQVSSDSHVGSLAEALLDQLKKNPSVELKIEEVRKQTRDEKKRLAMAVRKKHLDELGMTETRDGQLLIPGGLNKIGDLGDETGLTCNICREGYKYHPSKVLAIYTFTKRCHVEPFEGSGPTMPTASSSDGRSKVGRKTMGFTTVTHFNIVHVDCHMAAVRHARARDEWESAALQNANTKCNGLLPLWGPGVQEPAFASCLARHNTYVQEATGHRDINYTSTIHDLKLLIGKFANEESFSTESGGGGSESNIHLIPYLIHEVLYVLNTTQSSSREAKRAISFLESPPNKWIDSAFEAEGINFWSTMFVMVHPRSVWRKYRVTILKRFLIQAQARSCLAGHRGPAAMAVAGMPAVLNPSSSTLPDKSIKDFSVYKPSIIFFAMIDHIYNVMFKDVTKETDWSLTLADYIRNNDQALVKSGDAMLETYQEDLIQSQSLDEILDVMNMLGEVPNPVQFIQESFEF